MSSAHSRSSSGALDVARDAALSEIVQTVRAIPNAVVLIDGQSGALKTTLADMLVAAWPGTDAPQLIAMDSVYPGWDGLDAGVRLVTEGVLEPRARGLLGHWRAWDWGRNAPAHVHAVDPTLPLVVEGSGILTPETAALADVGVWMSAPETSRRDRALARDGDTYRPHWERWAAQERRHIERDRPHACATHLFELP